MEVSDRIVVMNEGRIEQVGTPDEVYDKPATPFVLQFLGDVNLFHGRRDHAPGQPAAADGAKDVIYVRPHEIDIVTAAGPDTWAVTLSREAWTALRGRPGLRPGSASHLKPRRITRFQEVADDPAAAI